MPWGRQKPEITPELLLDLYECALQPDQWPSFFGRLATALNADSVAMRVIGVHEPTLHRSFVFGLEKPSYPELVRNDPFRDRVLNVPLGQVLCTYDMYSDEQFENTIHYQHYFRHLDKFFAMGCILSCKDDRALQIGLHRSRKKGNFNVEERACLGALAPHLRQAATIQQLMGEVNNLMQLSLQCLDRLSCGVWLLEVDLRCQWMNSAAREVIEARFLGLSIEHNRLQLGSPGSTLQRHLGSFMFSDKDMQTLRLSNGKAALMLCRSESSAAGTILDASGQGIMVFLLNPNKPPRLNADTLCSLYQLTPAEIRLAHEMVQGRDMVECADHLYISLHTARTHLKSILRKTGTRRQAELMQKLMLSALT